MTNGFFNWVSIYHSVMANLMDEDRTAALEVIDDDVAFDTWMQDYQRKRQQQAAKNKTGARAPAMGNEEYLKRHARIIE